MVEVEQWTHLAPRTDGIDNCMKTFLTSGNDCDHVSTSSAANGPAFSASYPNPKGSKSATATWEDPSASEGPPSSSRSTDSATTTSLKGKHTHSAGGRDSSAVSSTASWTTAVSSSTPDEARTATTLPATSSPASTHVAEVKCKCAKPWDEDIHVSIYSAYASPLLHSPTHRISLTVRDGQSGGVQARLSLDSNMDRLTWFLILFLQRWIV